MTGDAVPAVECRAIRVGYGSMLVLDGLDLAVAPGEMLALLGPSGSGKTTLLSAIAGFLPVEAGSISLGGRLVADERRLEPPERRDVGVVFQAAALWPHLTALETVAYPLQRHGRSRADARREAQAILDGLGIGGLADRRPAELSGGEQQRVGLGRAIAHGAHVQLFDEPTAHLDIPLREQLLELLARQRRDAGAAGLYATHDTTEALALADRVALMRDGRIVQVGLPRDVYDAPVDAWAARLTGPAAEVEVRIVAPCGDGRVELDVAGGRAVVEVVAGGDSGPATDARPGDRWRVVVRPDWAALGGTLPGRVSHVAFHGTHTDVRLATDAGEVAVRTIGSAGVRVGEPIGWSLHRVRPVESVGRGQDGGR